MYPGGYNDLRLRLFPAARRRTVPDEGLDRDLRSDPLPRHRPPCSRPVRSGGSASGRVLLQHHGATGLARFVGTVTCVVTTGDETTVAGLVARGQDTRGVPLDGRTYALTITTAAGRQSFTLPAFDVSTTACEGSDLRHVPVTSGRLRATGWQPRLTACAAAQVAPRAAARSGRTPVAESEGDACRVRGVQQVAEAPEAGAQACPPRRGGAGGRGAGVSAVERHGGVLSWRVGGRSQESGDSADRR